MANEKRLIDAKEYCKELYEEMNYPGRSEEFMMAIDVAIADLADAPTVDAVEVVHGRWLKTQVEAGDPYDGNSCYCFDVFQCSECGAHFDVSEALNYCPNCCAKMDGDGNG